MTSLTLEGITYRVRKIIANHRGCEPDTVALSDTMDGCGFDSLDHVQVVIALEDELRITIPDEDIFSDRTTVAEVIAYVAKKAGAL